ncbi:hypothetical protein COU18_00220 [Candidatus Kaiserbacteria bacterium CG10_big_fil_rev_8_21_14_0_10_51_14]|uniref:Chromosomal replication initiator DnaA C-terminal domain-containing protein n=1 Tax=Candidatus Kaiserbacteria bacterium CG10_big_fil_rev_8_21_14_0_10_51_14 TaxID=1974610 RepID=A0A2H0UCL3_9BACT|nr:MAG: hypothetical protein COU18_00220 [Candidatus Kaiserbacteria bacterium CG10_big_fil_rev_8_21_14_0_10_51_14]
MEKPKKLKSARGVRGMITVAEIRQAVENASELDWASITSPSREASVAAARAIAMYLGRQLLVGDEWSYRTLAKMVGRRDHTTAINACHAIDAASPRAVPQGLIKAAESLGVNWRTFVPLHEITRWEYRQRSRAR